MRPLAVLLVLSALAIGQWPLLRDIHAAWVDKYGAYSHGYLVLAIAVVLAVGQWRRPPPPARTGPCWAMLPVLAALVAGSLVLERLFIGGTRSLLLPPMIFAATAVAAGWPAARRLLGPAAFLYLALPVWHPVNGMLQSLTTSVAGAMLQLLRVPVYLEGNFVHLPSGTFEIAAGCSGLNYLLSALTIGAFACAFLVDGWKKRLTIMGAAAALGLAANWIRVVSLVVIGHRTEMQHYLIRVDHLMFGWVVFLLAMVPVFVLARRFSGGDSGVGMPAPTREIPATSGLRAAAGIVLACLLLLAPVLLPGTPRDAFTAATAFEDVAFPSGWRPGFVGASIERALARAPGSDATVEVVRASYAIQRRESRISLYRNTTTGAGWAPSGSRKVAMRDGNNLITEHQGSLAGRQGLIWDWYVVAGRPVASSKAHYRLREFLSLFSRRKDAAIIALHSNCEGNCEDARHALQAVAEQLLNTEELPIPSQFPSP